MPEGHELIGLDQSTEGRFDQFVALFHVAEDLIPEDEESAIDPEVGILIRVCTYNLAEDDFRDCSYEAILRRLRASTGHRKFDVVPAPVIADRLISFARFGNLPVRFTFGQMVFATDKLKEEGFRPRFGIENLYREAIGRISATQE